MAHTQPTAASSQSPLYRSTLQTTCANVSPRRSLATSESATRARSHRKIAGAIIVYSVSSAATSEHERRNS